MRGKRAFPGADRLCRDFELILGLIFLGALEERSVIHRNQSGRVLTPVLVYVQMS